MLLYFLYTMVQKVKNDLKLKSRGPALKYHCDVETMCNCCVEPVE